MIKSTINFFTWTYLILNIMFSCVPVDGYDVPLIEIETPDISANSNINAVKSAYDQSGLKIYTFNTEDNSIIEGFVISSDEASNFYKSLIIQDKNQSPNSGIEILIDQRAYFTKYNFGRKIYVKMAGLSISNNNGKYIIGYNLKNKVEEIPNVLLDDFIIRSAQTESIVPVPIDLSDFIADRINLFVEINNLQFKGDEIGKTFAGENFDEFNGERVLIQCSNQIRAILSTSTFSDFKSILVSDKVGSLNAILTKDYSADKYVLIVNDLTNILFSSDDRCDPNYLHCTPNGSNQKQLIFFENFENVSKTKNLDELGWINWNVYLGNERFNKRSSQGNISMQISAYNTKENPLEVWLITPPINLDRSKNEVLTFDTKATYDNGLAITAWVSTNFKDNIKNANWQQLNANFSVGPGNTFQNDFISSGEISLDCLDGDVFIAIKYLGSDSGISTTYDIDNFKILGTTN